MSCLSRGGGTVRCPVCLEGAVKMHIYDMVKIDTIVFEIIGGGGGF